VLHYSPGKETRLGLAPMVMGKFDSPLLGRLWLSYLRTAGWGNEQAS
jgi:hypothetical protein